MTIENNVFPYTILYSFLIVMGSPNFLTNYWIKKTLDLVYLCIIIELNIRSDRFCSDNVASSVQHFCEAHEWIYITGMKIPCITRSVRRLCSTRSLRRFAPTHRGGRNTMDTSAVVVVVHMGILACAWRDLRNVFACVIRYVCTYGFAHCVNSSTTFQ